MKFQHETRFRMHNTMLLSILVVIFQLVHYFREPGISIYSTNFLGDKIVTTCSVIDEKQEVCTILTGYLIEVCCPEDSSVRVRPLVQKPGPNHQKSPNTRQISS